MTMKRILLLAVSAGALVLQSGNALADKCMYKQGNSYPDALGDKSSWAIVKTQASGTFDDWIWRGPEFFRCPKTGVNFCTDSYGKEHSQGYAWTVGISLNFGGIPFFGGYGGLVGPSGSFERNETWTEVWTRSIQLQPGYASKPIQVVVRRWKSGDYRGMHVNTKLWCNEEQMRYRWDGNRRFAKWQGNVQESRWFGYQTYKY